MSAWSPEAATDLLWALLSVPVWEDLALGRGWATEDYVYWVLLAARRALVGDRDEGDRG